MILAFDRKARHVQRFGEALLLAFIFITFVTVFMKQSLMHEKVENLGFCLEEEQPVHLATDNLLQRMFQFYFNPRVSSNFVFSPVALQRTMINVAFGSAGETLDELKVGLNLPCDVLDFTAVEQVEHLDRVANKAFVRDLRGGCGKKAKTLNEELLNFARMDAKRDVFDSQRTFHKSLVVSEAEEMQHFGHSVNYITFYERNLGPEEINLMMGSKMMIGNNEDRDAFGKGTAIVTEAIVRSTHMS